MFQRCFGRFFRRADTYCLDKLPSPVQAIVFSYCANLIDLANLAANSRQEALTYFLRSTAKTKEDKDQAQNDADLLINYALLVDIDQKLVPAKRNLQELRPIANLQTTLKPMRYAIRGVTTLCSAGLSVGSYLIAKSQEIGQLANHYASEYKVDFSSFHDECGYLYQNNYQPNSPSDFCQFYLKNFGNLNFDQCYKICSTFADSTMDTNVGTALMVISGLFLIATAIIKYLSSARDGLNSPDSPTLYPETFARLFKLDAKKIKKLSLPEFFERYDAALKELIAKLTPQHVARLEAIEARQFNEEKKDIPESKSSPAMSHDSRFFPSSEVKININPPPSSILNRIANVRGLMR